MKKNWVKRVSLAGVVLFSLSLSTQAHAAVTSKTLDGQNNPVIKQTEVTNQADAKNLLNKIASSSVATRSNVATKNFDQYSVVAVEKDPLGYTHYTLRAKVNNVNVTSQEIKVHVNPENQVTLVNGDLNQGTIAPTNTVQLTKDTAVSAAYQAIGKTATQVKNIANFKVVNKAELAVDPTLQKNVYNIELVYAEPEAARWKIQIDAQTGAVLSKKNALNDATVVGSGTGVNGDTKTLNLTQSGTTYLLKDTTRTGAVQTYDAKNGTSSLYQITNSSPNFTAANLHAAVDANYYAGQVYDFYQKNFNRNSYDGKGAAITSVVHFNKNYNNAFWNGQYMVYGDGDGKTFTALSGANDVIAHELTHAVTETTANLAYENQPGALNESFSDVFGYFVDPEDWLIGEDVYTPSIAGDALRSLSNPETYNQPSTMANYQNLPNTEEGDYGGVHTNSGIPNKAAYFTISKVGVAKSEQIYYRALTQYLTSNAQFVDAKKALAQAAADLYGANSTEQTAVTSAWNAVGVTG